jgi:3-methyladenine DNA glycosylase AlkC
MKFDLYQINAFTDIVFGGNPACVVPLKTWLPDNLMLNIARENNVAETAVSVLLKILGEENPDETGMFSRYYWILPIGKFVEKFGLDHFDLSIKAISEITKRNTGEYAIRPYIRKFPNKTLRQMKLWAVSDNFHLRRLSSEGLRPRLPWATKLETFIDDPEPVFGLLDLLKEDPVQFVKKSVANHLTDWLKVNPEPTIRLIHKWKQSQNEHTIWILHRATRKTDPDLLS